MDRRRAAGALLALAACVASATAAPATSNQTALDLIDGPSEGCYYNFQHYGEGDRIMTNEPCLNCTCHNRMLMCYLRVCPFTKPIGQDCTIEKRADQCCPIVTCPDVPVDLLTSTSTSSPAEYGATGLGKVDKYGCSINGKYFSEGSKVPPSPNKPCEHCYCIRNMTTCVMQECTLHVDGCTPIYHKDVCCPVRYSCDHQEDEILLLDDMTTTVRPTPGFLLTTTTTAPLSQMSQDCVHDDQIFADGALIKTEKACEHCYCMKGDIVCVVQECGTPMENEGKNCTSLPPRVGQCCPDTYICEGDELLSAITTTATYVDVTTSSPPKRVEGSGYRNEPDEAYTEIPAFEGSGEEQATTLETSDVFTSHSQSPEIIDEVFAATEEPFKPSLNTFEPDKGQNTVPDDSEEITQQSYLAEKTSLKPEAVTVTQSIDNIDTKETESIVTVSDFRATTEVYSAEEDELIKTTESLQIANKDDAVKIEQTKPDIESTTIFKDIEELTTQVSNVESSSTYAISSHDEEKLTTLLIPDIMLEPKLTTTEVPQDVSIYDNDNKEDHKDDASPTPENDDLSNQMTTTISRIEPSETTSVNPVENEIDEDLPPGRIPGEGDCLLNGVTYKNNTNVPNINNCHSSCKCASSIVKCDPIICSPPPEQMDNMNDCQPIYDTPDACCPTYVCHSRETIPPESHSQMAGTESPKSSPEQPETDCQGEQCESHKITPTSSEPCTVESCQAQADDQVNDCKNNDCVQTETTLDTSSAISAEGCIGEMCLPSKDSCADGHCQEPTTSEHFCDSDKGCQPSGECEGGNCGTDQKLTNPEVVPPMCEDPEECKMSGVPEMPIAPCSDDHECKNGTETTLEVECEEQNCRRKEQPAEENKPQTICSDSSCTTKDIVQDESSIFTTESSIKLQPPKEPSSEMIDKEYSTLPESDLSPTTHDIHKVTKSEDAVTETQDISMEVTTEQSDISSSQNFNEYVTANESSSETSVPFVTKAEEEITEKPHIDDVQTITSDSYTSKSVDETTESLEIVTKETTNELPQQPLETQHEEHPTESSEKVTTGLPDKHTESQYLDSLITSTETDIKSSEKENNENDTNKIPVEQITQKQEFSTELPNIFVTTTKQPQIVVSEPELPNTDEIYTETPVVTTSLEEVIPSSTEKDKPIKNYTPDQENTISNLEVSITESSATIVDETITENHVGVETNDENMKHTGGDIAVTESPEKLSPEQSVPLEQSTESQKTNLLDIIDKEYDDTEKDKITTEINDVLTEQTPSRTTEYEPFITNQDKETSQIIDGEKVTETKEDNVSSVQEQHETTEPSKYTKISSDEQQNTHTSTVQPLVTETQTQEISVADDTKLTESPINESPDMTADFDTKESSTQYPEISITTLQESTTKLIKTDEIPLHPSVTVEDHTDQSVLDSIDKKTTIPEEKLEDGESSSTLEPQKEEVTYVPDEPILGMETTVSSLLPDKNEEESTKLTETDISAGESSTLPPEILTTKYDDILTSISNEIERKPIGTESSSQEDNEIVITESSKPLDAETYEISGHSSVTSPDQYSDEQTTEVSMELMTESHPGSDEISVTEGSLDENKTERTASYTSHYLPNAQESGIQHSEKSETTLSEQFVTENIDNEVRGTDMQKPTEYPASFETETQNIQSSISITQSQDFETKLVTKLDTYEISTTPGHSIKEVQTETPLSLITEEEDPSTSSHSVPSEDVHKPEMDKTTHDAPISVSNEELTEEPESHYTELQKPSTESLITALSDKEKTETLSQTYTEKESYPESISTTVTYPSSPFLDTNVEENPSSTDTDTTKLDVFTISENIASTTELPNKITPLIQDSSDSDLHQTIVLQETTSVPEIVGSSDKSISIPEQEMETESPAISVPVTIVEYDEIHDTKHETKPSDEDTMKGATEQPLFSVDLTTTYSKPETETESAKEEDQNHISITEPTVQEGIQAVTVDYPNYLDKKQEDESDLHKPSKQGASTLTVDERATTESFIDLEQPTIGDGIQYDTKVENQEKSTESSIMLDSKIEITTPLYQDSTTSEESGISLIDEEHRRTLAPELERETDQTERSTTETLKITELPDLIITQNKEHSEVMQEMSTIMPDRESVTLVTILDIDASPQTEILPTIKDIDDPVITESKDTSTKESQEVTSTPTYVELDDGHVTEKDETMDKPTAHDLVRIPVETKPEDMPSDNSVTISTPKETSSPLESGTEISIPRETDSIVPVGTEASVSKETEMNVPVETEKDTFVPEETETTSPIRTESTAVKETDMTVSKVTEASIPKETDDRDLKVSETTDTTIPKDTATDEMTKEPEKTTNRPKDDQSQEFDGSSATPEVVYSSSETTPYLVELQEHTNKIDETISTVLPIEEYTSKSPDVFQTERGDQPLDITQEEVKEHTTVGTTEKLTEQPTESPTATSVKEQVTQKAETEIDLVTSESPISTPSDIKTIDEVPTLPSGELSTTISPAVSEITKVPGELTTLEYGRKPTTDKIDLLSDIEKAPEQEVMHEATIPEDELSATITKASTIKTTEDTTTQIPILHDKFTKPEDKPIDSHLPTLPPELTKPDSAVQPAEEVLSPDFPPSGTSGYGQEPDYVEEDQAFGPGTCRYGGKVYVSAQQIPRDDPCDFCFCFRSDIICLQQSCPPPIHGCHEEPIQGFCCPRYECPVSMATTLNVTTTTTTTTTTLPPHFLPHAYKGAAQRRGCQIKGHSYKVGEVVRASSGPCLHCTCGGDGQMKCDPKACTPEPMLRQMIAAAVSAKRRR